MRPFLTCPAKGRARTTSDGQRSRAHADLADVEDARRRLEEAHPKLQPPPPPRRHRQQVVGLPPAPRRLISPPAHAGPAAPARIPPTS